MSAFFGLTLLGSQSPFDPVKETPIHAFQSRDFQDAFMQTYRPGFSLYSESDEGPSCERGLYSATITLAQLPVMLRYLYKCPRGVDNVSASTRKLVEQAFRLQSVGADASQSIDLQTFLAQMEELCRHSQSMESAAAHSAYLKDGATTREFVSNLDFLGKLVKHTRMEKDPRQKTLAPVTDSMTLGWNPPTMATKRKPTKSCEETRYACAMVKAGVYYY